MILLFAESGTTKCQWTGIDASNGEVLIDIYSKGLNPSMFSRDFIAGELNKMERLKHLIPQISHVYFFGAGCGSPAGRQMMEFILKAFFVMADEISVTDDMAAAVYACTRTPAVVGILGTGSNACFFDGEIIQTKIPSLGFILMDDGSGNHLGRLLLRSYYFGEMDQLLMHSLEKNYELDPDKVKPRLYKEEGAATYLATFAEFVIENKAHPQIRKIIEEGFYSYIHTQLKSFRSELEVCPLHLVGSVSFLLQDVWKEIALREGFLMGSFIKNPMEGLIKAKWKNQSGGK